MLDLILRGGRVVDGTGAAWFWGDVAIRAGRIVAIGDLSGVQAVREIALNGSVVAPGFIDIHTHSDLPLLVNPLAESAIRQGITTAVVGNCGLGYAPLAGDAADSIQATLSEYGLPLSWGSMAEYLGFLESCRPAQNVAALIGLGIVRQGVVGGANRAANPDELEAMKALVAQAMADGAYGISSGLIYPPSSFATTEELVELARVAARYGGIYTTHMRNEADHLVEAVAEAIAVGERSGAAVEISHHKVLGPGNWGTVRTTVGLMEAARRRGVDVTMDQYPYTASATGLSTVVPLWAHDGGKEALVKRLTDPALRPRIVAESTELVRRSRGGWDKVFLSAVLPEFARLEGKSLAEAAAMEGCDPAVLAVDLLVAHAGSVGMVAFGMCEEDVRFVMQHPLTMIGSDGAAYAPYGVMAGGKPHPRNYGAFVRVLGRYVREEQVLTLEEAVRKMTSLPARKLGLWDRGLLRPGMVADLAVFDPDQVADRADFANPHQYAAGVSHVIVAGTPVVEDGEHTGARPGVVLRRGE